MHIGPNEWVKFNLCSLAVVTRISNTQYVAINIVLHGGFYNRDSAEEEIKTFARFILNVFVDGLQKDKQTEPRKVPWKYRKRSKIENVYAR